MMAERGMVYTAESSAVALSDLLKNEGLAEATALLLRLSEVYFEASLPADFQPDDWPQGRVFTPALEVRWWRSESGFRVEALSERELPKSVAQSFGAGEDYAVLPTQLLLAGTYYPLADDPEGGFFAEAQVPQPLRHPYRSGDLSQGDQVQLRARLYLRDGIVCRTRFQEVARHGE
jgi:ribosomal protein S14